MKLTRLYQLGAFSEAVIVADLVMLSGQVALDARSGPFDAQLREVLSRIDGLLVEAGSDRGHLVQALVHLVRASDVESLNRIWIEWLGDSGPPARTTVVSALTSSDFLVEITVTAAIVARAKRGA